MAFRWSSELAIGDALIDAQHQNFIDHFNRLLAAFRSRSDEAEIMACLEFFVEYADMHFRCEEELMARCSFPGIESHKRYHAMFRDKVAEFRAMLAANGLSPQVEAALQESLLRWLLHHIKTQDREIGRFLSEKGAQE